MSDNRTDELYRLAETQSGYFTASQAAEVGFPQSTLQHHARDNGRYLRIQPGLYRIRHFPSSEFEHIYAAWLPLKKANAVVSHASALELHGLSDIIPSSVHVTVPRTKRGQRPRPHVTIHTTHHPLEPRSIQGLPVTSPEVSIVDSALTGEQPEQIHMAVQQALERGITTEKRLRHAAELRGSAALASMNTMLGLVQHT